MQKKIENLGIMIDCSRNAVRNPDSVKRMIDLMSDLGYNFLMLYTEDTFEVNNQPYFGHLRGRYSKEEIKDLDKYAIAKGIKLIPCIQTLAHLNGIFRWPQYAAICDCDDILMIGDERVYTLIEDIFATLSEVYTSTTVHIGMDEAEFFGCGKYLRENGYTDRTELFLQHLNRVSEIAEKYGFNLVMWGDMFFKLANNGNYYDGKVDESLKAKIPSNVTICYWDYYSKDKKHYDQNIKNNKAVQDKIWFAGGAWTWGGFTPHNHFSLETNKAAIESCIEHSVKDVCITMWGDNGGECSVFSVLPNIYAVSEYAKGNFDMDSIKAGFEDKYGIAFDDFMLIDLPDTANTDGDVNNCEKQLLYNDCLMGLVDCVVRDDDAKRYAECAKKLQKMTDNEEYGFIFKTAKAICDVLEYKYDIGIKTRKAYLEKDMDALKALIPVYDEIVRRINVFYDALETQWYIENKPHGFDMQDIRIGGVIRRIEHCKKTILKYINGEIEHIPELEEPVLDYYGKGEPQRTPFVTGYTWANVSSVNVYIF